MIQSWTQHNKMKFSFNGVWWTQSAGGCQYEKSTSEFRTTYTMRMKSSLMLKQSHTKTSPPRVCCKQTAPKLLYVAKGLKYGWFFTLATLPEVVWCVLSGGAPTSLAHRCPISACLNVRWETTPSEGSHDPPVTPAQNTTNVALWPRLLIYI